MEIPAEVRVLGAIQSGSVFYFEEENLDTTDAHFFIVVNKDPRTEELLILVVASSQVEKRKKRASTLGFPLETLVFISPAEYPLFTKDTVIDCNRAFEKTPQSLVDKFAMGRLRVCMEVMDAAIVEKLKAGVIASTQVAENIKKQLVG